VLLPPDQIGLIRAGQRTLVIVPRGDEAGDRPPYPVGARIPLHRGVGVRAAATVIVTRVSDVAVDELDDHDARGLGFGDVGEFRRAWRAQHGDELGARAWIMRITCAPRREAPRLLRRKLGYTTNPTAAVPEAGEAVDVHVNAGYGRAAEKLERGRVAEMLEQRKALQPYNRLAMVIGEADARGIDINRHMFIVLQRIESMEQLVHRVADRTANEDD
jgi:hypothetical protein